MIELVKVCLAYLSYGLLICCMVSVGLLLQDNMSFCASVVYLAALLFVYYLCRKIALCHRDGTPVSQTLKGNMLADVFLVVVFVQAWADDLQEEKWYNTALLACLWAVADFLRCMLDAPWRNGMLSDSQTGACRQGGKAFGNSPTFILRSYIGGCAVWLVLMCFFYLRHGFDSDFIIDMIWYFAVVMAIVSISVLGTRVSVGRDSIIVYQHGNVAGKRSIRYCEIVNVVVDRSLFWGPRMTIFYGNGKTVVAYPADIEIVANFLRKQHVNVENKL